MLQVARDGLLVVSTSLYIHMGCIEILYRMVRMDEWKSDAILDIRFDPLFEVCHRFKIPYKVFRRCCTCTWKIVTRLGMQICMYFIEWKMTWEVAWRSIKWLWNVRRYVLYPQYGHSLKWNEIMSRAHIANYNLCMCGNMNSAFNVDRLKLQIIQNKSKQNGHRRY